MKKTPVFTRVSPLVLEEEEDGVQRIIDADHKDEDSDDFRSHSFFFPRLRSLAIFAFLDPLDDRPPAEEKNIADEPESKSRQ